MNKVKGLLKKDLLGLRDISCEEINLALDTASSMKEVFFRPVPKVPALLGKSICLLFYEPSTRTRTSFEAAAKMLSASITNVAIAQSSAQKGETLIDTVKNLEVMGHQAFVIRHKMSGAPLLASKNLTASVINAGDGFNEHPTQGLLDIFTMREKKGNLKGKKIVIVGDIAHSRVARSNIWGLIKLGAKVSVVGPPTLIPKDIEKMGVKVNNNIDEELEDADFINVLRIQLERMGKGLLPSLEEYHMIYGINAKRLEKCKKDIVIMHPGPINRGVEISSEVADGPYNVILDQVQNGVAVRMAVLFLLLGGRQNAAE
ncbi:MAG: aspartate carbamoyltransferase catalytic subunit [Candidatus Saganbacteria bacterium]|uniref:Aspartate carbamoyltransferase n=1 Tax=Candidatus Saganbacteria bacterium TaxID=2575572 RepID=A0A833KZN2_UNCSA|nr:MAG: aspartate carbamoyltransferase catalytic subunit [Candidatus Saganbacteria bacterium]